MPKAHLLFILHSTKLCGNGFDYFIGIARINMYAMPSHIYAISVYSAENYMNISHNRFETN
ncbi:MAG: hypothetical protein AA908_11400 [Chlorobi bacterium NICIL-2]|nr:MAG: hypothetical protein AA908_11400 [Chlorobi bacterium NICIL-2]